MYDDRTQRAVLEAVNDRFERGKTMLRESDIREIGEEAGLDLQGAKRLLGRLTSPDGPIVGEPIPGSRRGLVGISVEDVYL